MRGLKILSLSLALGLCLSAAESRGEEGAAAVNNTTGAQPAAPARAVKPDQNGYYVGGPVYVSDKNRIWTRSGPSEGYRITGSRRIGEKMIFKRYSENGQYAQLEADGETFWMKLDTLQPESCGYSKEEELSAQIADLQYKLDNYDSDLTHNLRAAVSERDRLNSENAELKAALTEKEQMILELDEQNRDYAERLQTRELDMQMRWWGQGALITIIGAILGVIFVYLPRPTRKVRRERY